MIGDRTALLAAGIDDPRLRAAYLYGRQLLISRHGPSYWAASLLAPARQRAHLWAIYGFARATDDLLDQTNPQQRLADFDAWKQTVQHTFTTGASENPVCAALLHTTRTFGLDTADVFAQLTGHRLDLTNTEYATWDELNGYIDGVAGAFGRLIIQVLQPTTAVETAKRKMTDLLAATQLTDFLQDLTEDLRLGRLYLPVEDLDRHNVTRNDLAQRPVTAQARALVRFEVERARRLYASGRQVMELLPPPSRPTITATLELTAGILDDIARRDFDVLSSQPGISMVAKARIAMTATRARLVAG
jgi:phytoene synthase